MYLSLLRNTILNRNILRGILLCRAVRKPVKCDKQVNSNPVETMVTSSCLPAERIHEETEFCLLLKFTQFQKAHG
jgi:hypothetical protein